MDFLFLALNARPLSRRGARRGKPLTAQGAAGQTTRKWTVCWKRFDGRLGEPTSSSVGLQRGRGQLFMPRQYSHACVCVCQRSRWPSELWRPPRLLSFNAQLRVGASLPADPRLFACSPHSQVHREDFMERHTAYGSRVKGGLCAAATQCGGGVSYILVF